MSIVTSWHPSASSTNVFKTLTRWSTFFSLNALGRPTALGALFWAKSRPIVEAERWRSLAIWAGVLPWSKWSLRARAFSAGGMRGGCAIGAMGQKTDAPVVRAARRSLSQQRAPYRWPSHISTQEKHFICEAQTVDGINFANLFESCSGSPEYTHACHDTRPHLGKSTTPSPPHAMLT